MTNKSKKKTLIYLVLTFLIVLGLVFILANYKKSSTQPPIQTTSTESCDIPLTADKGSTNLIVKARTVGNEHPQQKIEILETLHGIDSTGDTLYVYDRDMRWQENKEYMLFLENHGIGEDGNTILIEAKDSNTEIKRRMERCNKAILWMVHEDSWGVGTHAEFVLLDNLQYELKRLVDPKTNTAAGGEHEYETIRGKMDKTSAQQLLNAVAGAGEGADAEDAGIVIFTWRNGFEEVNSRQYNFPPSNPPKNLINLITKKAVEYQQN